MIVQGLIESLSGLFGRFARIIGRDDISFRVQMVYKKDRIDCLGEFFSTDGGESIEFECGDIGVFVEVIKGNAQSIKHTLFESGLLNEEKAGWGGALND